MCNVYSYENFIILFKTQTTKERKKENKSQCSSGWGEKKQVNGYNNIEQVDSVLNVEFFFRIWNIAQYQYQYKYKFPSSFECAK